MYNTVFKGNRKRMRAAKQAC